VATLLFFNNLVAGWVPFFFVDLQNHCKAVRQITNLAGLPVASLKL
jgi:hypothetical protein